jgi:hypothetical protein
MEQETKVRENRVRRAADRQGLRLSKSRVRDPNARDFGLYALVDQETHPPPAQRWVRSLTIDEVEAYLNGGGAGVRLRKPRDGGGVVE